MWRDSERRGMRDVLGIAIVLASSLCIAFVPSSAKISMNEGASLMMLLVSRCLIGAGLLLPLTLVQRQKLLVPRALLGRTIIATLFNIGMIGCLYSAIQFVDVGLAVLILHGTQISSITVNTAPSTPCQFGMTVSAPTAARNNSRSSSSKSARRRFKKANGMGCAAPRLQV